MIDLSGLLEELEQAQAVTLDTETSSLYPMRDGNILAGLAIKPFGKESRYLPYAHEDCVTEQVTREQLTEVLERCRGKSLIMHNAPFDVEVIYQFGVDLSSEKLWDTMVSTRLCYEDLNSYKLKDLGCMFVREDASVQEELLKKYMQKYKMKRYSQVPPEVMTLYARGDADLTEGLFRHTRPLIKERGLEGLMKLESRLTNSIIRMEITGIRVDPEYIRQSIKDMEKAKADMLKIIFEMAGREFNVQSTDQLAEAFHAMGIRSLKMTDGGKKPQKDGTKKPPKESWDMVALALIDHPMAHLVRLYRTFDKMIGTYFENFLELSDEDRVLHCKFRQSGTRTGRMSCAEPNLQNVPRFEGFSSSKMGAIAARIKTQIENGLEFRDSRTGGMVRINKEAYEAQTKRIRELAAAHKREIAFLSEADPGGDIEGTTLVDREFGEAVAKVRGAFVPTRPDEDLWFVDFQQMEMRVFADYADEKALFAAFDFGLDVHMITARAAFGDAMPLDHEAQEYKWYRNMGKQIAFGLIYGMGNKLLAIEIGRSVEEANMFKEQFFNRFKGTERLFSWVDEQIADQGFLVNRYGRRRYLGLDRSYVGVNFLVQGTCADMMKDALNRVDQMIMDEGFRSRLLLSVHDELVFSVVRTEAEVLMPKIASIMVDFGDKMAVKLQVDLEWGPNWSEKRNTKCLACDGKGFTVDVGDDKVTELLLSNQFDALLAISKHECQTCTGRGYDLNLWKAEVTA